MHSAGNIKYLYTEKRNIINIYVCTGVSDTHLHSIVCKNEQIYFLIQYSDLISLTSVSSSRAFYIGD